MNRPIGVAAVVFGYLEKARTLSFPGLCARVLSSKLGHAQRDANLILHLVGEAQQVTLR